MMNSIHTVWTGVPVTWRAGDERINTENTDLMRLIKSDIPHDYSLRDESYCWSSCDGQTIKYPIYGYSRAWESVSPAILPLLLLYVMNPNIRCVLSETYHWRNIYFTLENWYYIHSVYSILKIVIVNIANCFTETPLRFSWRIIYAVPGS